MTKNNSTAGRSVTVRNTGAGALSVPQRPASQMTDAPKRQPRTGPYTGWNRHRLSLLHAPPAPYTGQQTSPLRW